MNFFTKTNQYYKSDNFILGHGDSIELMKKIPNESIDLIITDPPYFLSNGGITCKSGQMVSVDKGNWDKVDSMTEMADFNNHW
jgi:site-specific DNA-methyltransferase (adenine-specific)